MAKRFNRAWKKGYDTKTINSQSVKVLEFDPEGRVKEFTGTAAATSFDSLSSFAKGAVYIKTDSATGVSGKFENIGTTSSSSFAAEGSTLPTGSISAAEIADGENEAGTYIKKTAAILYEFSVDGGTTGVITPAGNQTIPSGAIVQALSYIVNVTCTSAADTATIKFGFATDGDLTTAIAIGAAGNSWDTGVFSFASATGAYTNDPATIQLTDDRPVIMTVGVQNLTAGDITLLVDYLVMA